MKQEEIWLMLFHANISGYTSTEGGPEGVSLGHNAEVMDWAAKRTDYALEEFNKRWNKPVVAGVS